MSPLFSFIQIRYFFLFVFFGVGGTLLYSQDIKFDPGKKKFFIEWDGAAYTKAIYDTIIWSSNMDRTAIIKNQKGYGLLFLGGKKALTVLETAYPHILFVNDDEFLVKKGGKYALFRVSENIVWENSSPKLSDKNPFFKSEFQYDYGKGMSARFKIYQDYGDDWKTWNFGAVWKDDKAYIIDYNNIRHDQSINSVSCDRIELINIDRSPFFKIYKQGKWGIVNERGYTDIECIYDSIKIIRTMVKKQGWDLKLAHDFIVLHKDNKMYLTVVEPGSAFIKTNFLIDSYYIENNVFYFSENGIAKKIENGKKISTEFILHWTDKFETRIVEKNKRYGLYHNEREVLSVSYDVYPSSYENIGDIIYFFKSEGKYTIFSSSRKKVIHANETITDYTRTDVGIYVKRGDGKWYVFVNDAFSFFGDPEIGYDSIYEFRYPTKGILAYTNGKIHHYTVTNTFKEVSLPKNISNIEYIPDADAFIYKLNGKYGFSNSSVTFPAVIEKLNIGYEKKKNKNIFSVVIDGQEYFFYSEGFVSSTSLKAFIDCKACNGRGYNFGQETETRFVQGYTKVYKDRVFLWRDGEWFKITTEVVPDRYETTTHTTHDDCTVCSATGKETVWLKVENGKLVVK